MRFVEFPTRLQPSFVGPCAALAPRVSGTYGKVRFFRRIPSQLAAVVDAFHDFVGSEHASFACTALCGRLVHFGYIFEWVRRRTYCNGKNGLRWLELAREPNLSLDDVDRVHQAVHQVAHVGDSE